MMMCLVAFFLFGALLAISFPPTAEAFEIRRGTRRIRWVSVQASSRNLDEKFGFEDRFDRWRYMQRLLDESTEASEANEMATLVLRKFLFSPGVEGLPERTDERVRLVSRILDDIGDGVLGIVPEDGEVNEVLIEKLSSVLPDPIEDEDEFKSTWDILLDLHGREAVKLEESTKTPQWVSRSLVTRILIFYDFLSGGLGVAQREEN